MFARLRRRLAAQHGFTIVETLIASILSLIVTTSALAVLNSAYTNNADLQKRNESLQVARRASDEVVRRLRSQVCLNSTTTPVTAASGQSVTFYADFTEDVPTTYPERHVIALDTATGNLTDARYTSSTGVPSSYALQDTRVIAAGISEVSGTPMLQFYGYDTATPPGATVALNSGVASVTTANLSQIGRIVVTLSAKAAGTAAAKLSTSVQDEIFVRETNPQDTTPNPRCA